METRRVAVYGRVLTLAPRPPSSPQSTSARTHDGCLLRRRPTPLPPGRPLPPHSLPEARREDLGEVHRRRQRCVRAPSHSSYLPAARLRACFLRPPFSRHTRSTRVRICAEANETVDIEYRADRNSWDNFVTSVNEALNPIDLEFAHLHDEVSGKEMYAVVSISGLCSLSIVTYVASMA